MSTLDPKQEKKIIDAATKAATDAATSSAKSAAETKAASAAKSEVTDQLKTAFGVQTVSLDDVTKVLRKKLLDDAIDFETGTQQIIDKNSKTPNAKIDAATHRYTVYVPDAVEQTVLNLGHGDKGRLLPDPGISARTTTHIHLHTTDAGSSSYVALGDKQTAPRQDLIDPKNVLAANSGISAVTNGHLWAEAQGQLNLASHTNQAVLRAHKENVRVQADAKNLELGAGKTVVVGGAQNVNIVADSDIDPGDNAYNSPFSEALVEKSFFLAAKDAVTALDIYTACQSVIGAIKKTDLIYETGKITKTEKKNDAEKTIIDGAKALSSIGRFLAGKVVNGQVKIAAQSFASLYGMAGASVYGHLSASLTSMLSASVVGGTASLKGLKFASVWAKSGVSVRTAKGSASIKSDTGKVTINGHDEVNVVSAAGLNMGGDRYAELKSLKGHAYVGAPETKICAGRADGMGLLLDGSTAFLGTVSKSDEATSAKKETSFVSLENGKKPLVRIQSPDEIDLQVKGSHLKIRRTEIEYRSRGKVRFL